MSIKKEIINTVKELYGKDFIDSIGGNVSVKDSNRIFMTKTKSSFLKHWNINENPVTGHHVFRAASLRPEPDASASANSFFFILFQEVML